MTLASPPVGRRERNKQAKLDRITAAATALFAEHGADDVSTQQIAEAADIGAGTLFLYVKSKGELLLLVQNAHYADALAQGTADAAAEPDALEAVLALVRPIVACNRSQVDNGRTYLREILFGDPADPQHAQALAIVGRTEEEIAAIVRRDGTVTAEDARTRARVVSAALTLELATTVDAEVGVDELVGHLRTQLRAVLAR